MGPCFFLVGIFCFKSITEPFTEKLIQNKKSVKEKHGPHPNSNDKKVNRKINCTFENGEFHHHFQHVQVSICGNFELWYYQNACSRGENFPVNEVTGNKQFFP